MKTCCNPEHKEPVPATYAQVGILAVSFFCDACAWAIDKYGSGFELQEIAEWEEEQLSPEEKRREEWLEYGDQEYHRMKDEGLL